MAAKNLIGMKFGKLTVVDRGENAKNGKRRWVCDCDCGNRKKRLATSHDLSSGKVRSCGCLYKESNKGRNTKHGKTGERLYGIWCCMRSRCNYIKDVAYHRYGGNGISVCEEWNDFDAFCDWATKSGYADHLTIDRIDNDKGYFPENCRWATMREQQNNRSNNIRISIAGEEKTLSEWSEISGISSATLRWRVKNGWAEHELFMPVNLNNARTRKERKVC